MSRERSSLAPEGFYHHAPQLHLAFICVDTDEERLDLVTVEAAPDFDCAILRALEDMTSHGMNVDKFPIRFIGYVA